MTIATDRTRIDGLAPDLAALRRYFWLPLAALAIAVAAALALGAMTSDSDTARFRANVVVSSLPPLFGPDLLPGPFDYARLATSDVVLGTLAQESDISPDALKPRLSAEAQFNKPEINFKVTGANALPIARTWQRVFGDAAAQQTPDIERELAQPYATQLEQASGQLDRASESARISPSDPAALQQLKAAEENYETASKLAQSYEVVASTMKAQAFITSGAHGVGVGSTSGRLGAAIAIGLLAGVIGALLLDFAMRRRAAGVAVTERAPPELRRDIESRSGSGR